MEVGRGAAILAAGLVLAGCVENGIRVEAGQAPAHFRTYQRQYEEIVALVDSCRPARRKDAGYNRVWADRAASEGLYCRRGGDVDEIVRALRRIDAVSVSYSVVEDPTSTAPGGEIQTVSICVYSAGLTVSGTSTGFIYSFQTLDRLPPDEKGDGYGVERVLVGGPPHHWWWERSWT